MAVHVKTIEYAFQSRNGAALAAATRYDFGAITIYIPETTSRVFLSVRVQVNFRDAVTTATSATSPVVGIKLGAAAFDNVTLGNPPGNTGESGSYFFERDVTSYFTTNFGAGASQTCQVGGQVSGVTSVNWTAKVIITYECEDQQTRVKTVRIPLDSGTGALTASLAEIGTNQIPALDTFLPEASKTYRNIWFELTYNESTAGTVNDASLGMRVRSDGVEHLTGIHESGLASSCFGKYIWDQGATPVWATNAAQAFYLRSSTITTASTFNHVGIVLCVTYEYDHTNSSTIINSLALPMMTINVPGGTAATDETGAFIELMIEEPASITQVQSGILAWWSPTANINPSIKLGAGSERTYTDANLAYCGANVCTQRSDSGGAGGSAWTLARGYNQLFWRVRIATSGVTPNSFQGILYLNYTSGKHASGDGVHNRTTIWNVQNSQASGNISVISAAQWINLAAGDANYYVNSLGFLCMNVSGVANSPVMGIDIDVEALSGEISDSSYRNQLHIAIGGESELGVYPACVDSTRWAPDDWRRWVGDPETTRMDPEGSRRIKLASFVAGTRPLCMYLTHHNITFTVAGTVSDSAGGTVTLRAIRDVAGRREELGNTTRSGNGAFSITVYDSAENIYVEAREDASHVGRSESSVAS